MGANDENGSGDCWESLFTLVLIIRLLTRKPFPQLMPGIDKSTNYSISYNEHIERLDLSGPAQFFSALTIPPHHQLPHVAVYAPTFAGFAKYDAFMVVYDNVGNRTCCAYQLKTGKKRPKRKSNQPSGSAKKLKTEEEDENADGKEEDKSEDNSEGEGEDKSEGEEGKKMKKFWVEGDAPNRPRTTLPGWTCLNEAQVEAFFQGSSHFWTPAQLKKFVE